MTTEITSNDTKLDPKYRKIYRAMIEKGNKLDEIYKSPHAFSIIFNSETTLEREKLQRYCETLIFREPVLCGKKAEEILWRRVFYEIINIVKSNKKTLKCHSTIETMYRLHLSSAYGFYNHLILSFQSEFNSIIQLDGFLDFPCLSCEKPPPSQLENTKALRETLKRILHKFLICLGDLSRYQVEYDPHGCTRLAFKYYQMSLILIPSNGMPLNQLGTLYGSENYGCDAAYYYLYCLSCSDPFLSARENLRLLFLKNRKRYDEMTSKKFLEREKTAEYPLTELRTREIKKFLVLFLRIIDSILVSSSTILSSQSSNKSVLVSNQQLQDICQVCLQELNACMFYTNKMPVETGKAVQEADKLSCLSDELVFKLTMTILMTIEQLKARRAMLSGNKTNIYFTSVAFALVFFSHIVNHAILRLQEALLNLNKKTQMACEDECGGEGLAADFGQSKEIQQGQKKQLITKSAASNQSSTSCSSSEDEKETKKRRDVRLLYRLRRRKHNSDSDTNETDTTEDDELALKSTLISLKKTSEDDEEEKEEEEEEEEKEKDINSQIKKKHSQQKKKNTAKYIERENLSETELNVVSSSGDEYSQKKGGKKKQQQEMKKSEVVSQQLVKVSPSPPEKEVEEALNLVEDKKNRMNLLTGQSLNFKEFSAKLYSCLSLMKEGELTDDVEKTETTEHQITAELKQEEDNDLKKLVQVDSNYFIDNEIYKFILNGGVEPPPGFDVNSEEAKEIEELGIKLATFQIETDTEISLFNSSNTSSNNSDDLDEEEKKKAANIVRLQELKNAKVLISLLQTEALLPTIKVFCDWLLCNVNIIQSISQVSTTVWSKLAVLLNCIPLEKQIASESICENNQVRSLILKSFETKSWNSQPLSEDTHMRSFQALKSEHSLLEFNINKLNQLNVAEENLLRLCHLRRFGYLIASLSQSQSAEGGHGFFEYDLNKSAFKAIILNETKQPLISEPSSSQSLMTEKKKSKQNVNYSKDTNKFQLMKNMARLRLEAEISQLESNYRSDDLNWSPYLIADTASFCENLKLVQDLAKSSKFIIIVPLVVIDTLDSIKKESKLAREAIRWLENQFKQGNRFLRAQKLNEKLMLKTEYDPNIKKKNLEEWRFCQLVECCRYFKEESNTQVNREAAMANMVSVLTSSDKFKESMVKIAEENGIKLDGIKDFYEKWKKSSF